ncbi:hypothetical protein Ga0100231_010850 [Opitutaceae bacterium TAV4]|nr:hypothetical protein Ga0100231_010850 [Opitutaceae bacterium TAV4]RRJ98836.1 hypothetical protein Ga0100230_010955 [Opitutaceae bacterium TAV3]RRJ99012.1 hypothetical protein Ga0100230_012115 [Opitutaceae bacterium TAV3]
MMSFRSFVIFSLPLLLSALAWADEPSAAAPLQLQSLQLDEDFESGTLNQPPWSIQWLPADAANVAVQSDIVRAGKHAVRIVNRPEDEGRACERTELVNKHGGLKWGNEYWIGFSFYLKNWQTSRFGEMVHQFHAAAHKGDHTWRSGRNITSIFIERGEMQLQVITKPHDGPARGPASAVPVWKAPVESDVWQDWVIHVRPSPEENGLLEVWRNGQRLYVQRGPNVDLLDEGGRPAGQSYYIKCGVYNWTWKSGRHDVPDREIYYDEVRIGHVEAGYTGGYDGVAPGNRDGSAKPRTD